MRLTANNIRFMKCLAMDGTRYEYFVKLKDGDSRVFTNYENGKTVCKFYPLDLLPAEVKKFLVRSWRVWSEETVVIDGTERHFIEYIIR